MSTALKTINNVIISNILNHIVKGEANICCLCFSSNSDIALSDELPIKTKENEDLVTILDIIQKVLGNQISQYVSSFEKVCEECACTMSNIYTFIKNVHNNAIFFTKVINCLINNFDGNVKNSESLFVLLDKEKFTINNLYDNEKINSKSEALQRYNFLKTHLKKQKNTKMKAENEKHVLLNNIKTSDMLYDPNNLDLLKCKECWKVFCTKWSLRTHFMREHAPKIYKCKQCPRYFGSRILRDLHVNDNHCEVLCSECGKSFTNRCSLVRHELSHTLKLICADCGRSYKSSVSYKNHIKFNVCKQKTRASPKNAEYTCDYCNKKYTHKISLRVHIQYEHGNYKAHICEWCGKKFTSQSRMKSHIVKHTREKNFICTICQSKFVTKESLRYHTRLHTGEKPYKCSECGSNFESSSKKMYHMKTYHQEAAVECDICHSKFSSHFYLHKHKKCHIQPETYYNNINAAESNTRWCNKNYKENELISNIGMSGNKPSQQYETEMSVSGIKSFNKQEHDSYT